MLRLSRPLLTVILPALIGCSAAGSSVDVPAEGTIVLYSPAKSTASGHRFAATTIIFTTATKELAEEPDQGLQVTVGTRESDAPQVGTLTRIAQGSNRPATRILDAESFARLWRSVESAGLFRLPPHPSGRAPENSSYIQVKTGDAQRIYTRPRPTSSDETEDANRLMRYWRDSKMAIVSFLNS